MPLPRSEPGNWQGARNSFVLRFCSGPFCPEAVAVPLAVSAGVQGTDCMSAAGAPSGNYISQQ